MGCSGCDNLPTTVLVTGNMSGAPKCSITSCKTPSLVLFQMLQGEVGHKETCW